MRIKTIIVYLSGFAVAVGVITFWAASKNNLSVGRDHGIFLMLCGLYARLVAVSR